MIVDKEAFELMAEYCERFGRPFREWGSPVRRFNLEQTKSTIRECPRTGKPIEVPERKPGIIQ